MIATAGHVDHGKSTLVRALTGMEPDRLREERARGLTIDLGYAWTTIADGVTLAFVDVPGHQRFIANMLAGVGPVPAVLFVVAADAGWSAQSVEHLQALDALQVRRGVLAITRSDLGDASLAEAEAREHLAGTSLESIEAVAVSSVSGSGLNQLRDALARMTSRIPEHPGGRTRLWIDRVFTVHGSGTVVTGTLSGGCISAGESLQLHPSGDLVRARAVQSLNATVERADAVSRVAVNLRGVPRARVHRGDTLTVRDRWRDVGQLDVRLSEGQIPSEMILHLGSAAISARVRALGTDTARLTLARPVVTAFGERAILRDPGSRQIVAATVLDPQPPALRGRGAARRRAQRLADMTTTPDIAGEIRRRGAVRQKHLILNGVTERAVDPPVGTVAVGDWLLDGELWQRWRDRLPEVVDAWTAAHPEQPGMGRDAAADALVLPEPALLDPLLATQTEIVADRVGVHRRELRPVMSVPARAAVAALRQRLTADPFGASEAPELHHAGLTAQVLSQAVAEGELLRVTEIVYLLPDAIENAVRRLGTLEGPFTVAQAREVLQTTRRTAVPLLELMDRRRRTRRVDAQLRELIDGPVTGSAAGLAG